MTEALYEAFVSIGWWEILVTMCNTLITFLIIKKFLYKPVRKMLAARSEEVQSMYATAEKAQSEAEQMRSEYTERLSRRRRRLPRSSAPLPAVPQSAAMRFCASPRSRHPLWSRRPSALSSRSASRRTRNSRMRLRICP